MEALRGSVIGCAGATAGMPLWIVRAIRGYRGHQHDRQSAHARTRTRTTAGSPVR